MTQYGTATVRGADGSVTYNGTTPAIAALSDAVEVEDRANVEELLNGQGELIGFSKRDVREYATITLMAAGSTLNAAKQALKFPPIPSVIYFTPNAEIESTAKELFGDPAATPAAGSEFANRWIYVGGGRRSMSQGVATLQLTCFKAKTSPKTAAELTTAIS